jgi:hypothetical protein
MICCYRQALKGFSSQWMSGAFAAKAKRLDVISILACWANQHLGPH